MFDGGTLRGDPKSKGLTDQEVATPLMSVTSFLVVHPKGTLLWDTGAVPDDAVGKSDASQGSVKVERTLKSQLEAIGYHPADISYLALSHLHFDHAANANDYAASTWLVQQADRDVMFADKPYPFANSPEFYSALRISKTVLLHGDYDVFGDGSVVLKPTPGHTPGHQVLFVKLIRTGPVVLSGDLYHYPEERTLSRLPTVREYDVRQTAASRKLLETFLKEAGAELWIQHDLNGNAKRKRSPEYYE